MLRRRSSTDISSLVQNVKSAIRAGDTDTTRDNKVLIPTGSTLLNLALSDSKEGGFSPATVVNLVGDSSAGKTFLLWTLFAEAVRHPILKNYRLIYDEPETAFFMKAEKLFGIRPGRVEMDEANRSETIQHWYRRIVKTIEDNQPFIYGLDSFDSLSSEEEVDLEAKLLKSGEDGGSYQMQKPKLAGRILRRVTSRIEKTNSLVIVVSQTRDNIGVTFGEKKTRSGGNALRFYATHEVWLSVVNHEKRKDREVGVNVRAKVKKNKLTGKLRIVEFPIYFDYGVDDIGSCIDFLLAEGVWTRSGNKINTNGVFIDTRRDLLISHIEESFSENKLQALVEDTWRSIEASIQSGRKPKYAPVENDGDQESWPE